MVKLVSIVKNDPAKKETTYLADDGQEYTLRGDLSQRANNPGNISPTGDKAKGVYQGQFGAIGFLPSSNGPPVAVFPDIDSGIAAQKYLWSTPGYQKKTIEQAARLWAEKPYTGTLTSAAGVSGSTKVSDLDDGQMSAIMAAQAMAEGRRGLTITAQDGQAIPVMAFRGGQGTGGFQSAQSGTYTIQSGDTLSKIAARTGTTVAQLVSANGINNPNRIYAGETIRVPGQGSAVPATSSGVDTSSLAGVLKASAPRSLMSPSSSGVDTSSLAGIFKASGTTPTAAKQPESINDLINRNYLGIGDVLNNKFAAGIVYKPEYVDGSSAGSVSSAPGISSTPAKAAQVKAVTPSVMRSTGLAQTPVDTSTLAGVMRASSQPTSKPVASLTTPSRVDTSSLEGILKASAYPSVNKKVSIADAGKYTMAGNSPMPAGARPSSIPAVDFDVNGGVRGEARAGLSVAPKPTVMAPSPAQKSAAMAAAQRQTAPYPASSRPTSLMSSFQSTPRTSIQSAPVGQGGRTIYDPVSNSMIKQVQRADGVWVSANSPTAPSSGQAMSNLQSAVAHGQLTENQARSLALAGAPF